MTRYFSARSPFLFAAVYIIFNLLLVLLAVTFSWKLALNFFSLNGLIYPIYLFVHAINFRSHLRSLGYGWATFSDAFVLSAAFMWKAWGIPRHEEAATLPGYVENRQGLSHILQLQRNLNR